MGDNQPLLGGFSNTKWPINAAKLIEVGFFSSRRRHTRCLSDWSSDVCSSDLYTVAVALADSWQTHLAFRFCLPTNWDRKSTRLNSSHLGISYAVFCLQKRT